MPTYEYTCKECGDAIEVFQSFSERPLRKHTDCGGDLKKVFHASGVVFKGSGFYATDSRSSSSNSKSSDSSESPKPKKKSESKTPAGSSSSSD